MLHDGEMLKLSAYAEPYFSTEVPNSRSCNQCYLVSPLPIYSAGITRYGEIQFGSEWLDNKASHSLRSI
jgi:hypothetical protein